MPQMGYDTKTDWLTDCQSQYDFDFDFASHAALPLVTSKFRPNVALPVLVPMSP
jgi:hypothetical protein